MRVRQGLQYLGYLGEYYILRAADKAKYLRSKGARIGEGCALLAHIDGFGSEPYLVRLGNNVTITKGVLLLTHDGATRTFRQTEPRWTPGMGLYGPIDIADNVFIGVNAIILRGVTIGSNSIIGAGSVVTKDVPPDVVVAGNPARVISTMADYRHQALAQAVSVDISTAARKRRDLLAFFRPGPHQ